MPELPEVEQVRRSLMAHLPGRRIVRVHIRKPQVITTPNGNSPTAVDLLQGQTITSLHRHGKNLAILTSPPPQCPGGEVSWLSGASPCLAVHLGMTGSMHVHRPKAAGNGGKRQSTILPRHTHIAWTLDDGAVMAFCDPRRFGGIWTFDNAAQLHAQRLAKLGPDALAIKPGDLYQKLTATRRNLKATLLDQSVLAGLGNIYVDELLFSCRLHPLARASSVDQNTVRALVRRMRALLARAIASGGSTVRDYTDGNGNAGEFQFDLRVYGRSGQPCRVCRSILAATIAGGRTTVYCPSCQGRTRIIRKRRNSSKRAK
ncbi:MAG: bifunctional DNA-formamidopyrimidine glycosylase/DNA-(apurinic or apyrimidinic site) lyase [Phycisphaeraceae bacterium]|nr:bifunctional DNA-formamidopyrimidine glycosylase/DNA-(apurinic or apyrimidinic site) lyase [Phycisphaeraceae bacterium]